MTAPVLKRLVHAWVGSSRRVCERRHPERDVDPKRGRNRGHHTRLSVVPSRCAGPGYAIWPEGLGRVLDCLHAELPGTPLLVAEYGIGTDDDDQRAAYLQRGLELVQEALARGIDVRGFFHWTAVDNYEWFHGFEPTAAFGLIDRDRNVRASAEVLGREARGANG